MKHDYNAGLGFQSTLFYSVEGLHNNPCVWTWINNWVEAHKVPKDVCWLDGAYLKLDFDNLNLKDEFIEAGYRHFPQFDFIPEDELKSRIDKGWMERPTGRVMKGESPYAYMKDLKPYNPA